MKNQFVFYVVDTVTKKEYWFDLSWGNCGYGMGWLYAAPWGEKMTLRGRRDNVMQIDPDDCEIYLMVDGRKR